MTNPTPAQPKTVLDAHIDSVVQGVCEWDDRASPEDFPEALLVTPEELTNLLRDFAAFVQTQTVAPETPGASQCDGTSESVTGLTVTIIPYTDEDDGPDHEMDKWRMLAIGRPGDVPEHVLDRIPAGAAEIIRQHSEAQAAEIVRLSVDHADMHIKLKAANTKIERMRKVAEGSDQWANDVIAAICKHVGLDEEDSEFTADALAELLGEHSAEFERCEDRATKADAALSAMTAERDAALVRALKAEAAIVGLEGWKLVPITPTQDMLMAGVDRPQPDPDDPRDHEWGGMYRAIYGVMLDAAPPADRLVTALAQIDRALGQSEVVATNRVAAEIVAERRRQIGVEGWTQEHDDQHKPGTLALAAACYALPMAERSSKHSSGVSVRLALWPWDAEFWKPQTPRRDLIRAGALIVAEIERLDRATPGASS